jgi:DNA-binding NarL/FixJ family response regulator
MTRVFLASSQSETRSAFRLLLLDLKMLVVGEAGDWPTALAEASGTHPEMLVVDWNLIPQGRSLNELRATCADEVLIVLISQLDARRQAALSAGADFFVSKGEMPDRVTARLRSAAESTKRHATLM